MSLSHRQIAIVAALGAILWFAAAMVARDAGPFLFDQGWRHVLLYLGLFPVTWPFVILFRAAADLSKDNLFAGVAVGTMTALFLDGAAFAWLPTLYGPSTDNQLAGAASILWGAGVFLFIGWIMSRR